MRRLIEATQENFQVGSVHFVGGFYQVKSGKHFWDDFSPTKPTENGQITLWTPDRGFGRRRKLCRGDHRPR